MPGHISAAIAQQLALAMMGRNLDTQWAASTASVLEGQPPSTELLSAFYGLAVREGVFQTSDSPAALVNKIFQNIFGFNASEFEQTAWGNLIANGTLTAETAAWTMFASYLNATNLPDAYRIAAQSRLLAMDGYSAQLLKETGANLALAQGGSAAALARTYLSGVTSETTASTAIAVITANGIVPVKVELPAPAPAPAPEPPLNFTLTAGADVFTGGSANNTFSAGETAGASTFSAGDKIDGGAGADTLAVFGLNALTGTPANATVANVEIVNITTASTVTLNTVTSTAGFTGLTNLNTTSAGGATLTTAAGVAVSVTETLGSGSILVNGGTGVTVSATGVTGNGTIGVGTTTAAKGAVIVNETLALGGGGTGGAITVKGGSTVDITATSAGPANQTTTFGTITVIGTADTTAVTVTESAKATASNTIAGVVNGDVNIQDINYGSTTQAGTITSMSVSNFTSLFIGDNALSNLSVAGGSGDIIIDNSSLNTPTNKTLGLTINGQTGGMLDDADVYTTLNVTTTGANSTLANLTFGGMTALSVAGSQVLTLNSANGLSAVNTVTVSGSAGLKADFSGTSATGFDTSATTGTTTVTINTTKATFVGGAGVDNVTAGGNVSKVISLGAGDDTFVLGNRTVSAAVSGGDGTDTLSMTASSAATNSQSGTFAGYVTGFEALTLSGATNQTINLAVLGGYNAVSASGGNGLTLSNMASGGTLTLTGGGTAYTVANSAFAGGANDVLNLKLSTDVSTAPVNFAATGITASNVETINITTRDTQAVPNGAYAESVTLLGNSAKTITASGNASLTLTANSTALTSLDASGITLGKLSFISGVLASAANIKGSQLGGDIINASAAGAAVTIIETAGANNITGSSLHANKLTGGTGADTITGGSAADIIVGGGGADVITGRGGADRITISGSTAKVIQAVAGDSGTNTAVTLQTAELTSTFDLLAGVTAGNKLQLATNTPSKNLTAANLAGTDDVVNFARGSYDPLAGTFTYDANGTDTALTYDTAVGVGSAFETIILVGYVSGGSTSISSGLITFG